MPVNLKCCYETRPPKGPPFSSPGNYLPPDTLPDHTRSRSATLLSCLDQIVTSPDASCTTCVRTKKPKRLLPNTSFHLVKKAPARFTVFKVLGFIVFTVFNFFLIFNSVFVCFKAHHFCGTLGGFLVAACWVSGRLPACR